MGEQFHKKVSQSELNVDEVINSVLSFSCDVFDDKNVSEAIEKLLQISKTTDLQNLPKTAEEMNYAAFVLFHNLTHDRNMRAILQILRNTSRALDVRPEMDGGNSRPLPNMSEMQAAPHDDIDTFYKKTAAQLDELIQIAGLVYVNGKWEYEFIDNTIFFPDYFGCAVLLDEIYGIIMSINARHLVYNEYDSRIDELEERAKQVAYVAAEKISSILKEHIYRIDQLWRG